MIRYKLAKIDIPTVALAKELKLQSLEDRRFSNDILFFYKLLLNNSIDCPELLYKIPLNISHRTFRSTKTFYVPCHTQNYSHFAPLNRILLNGNFIRNFDLSFQFNYQVKKALIKNCFNF